MLRDMSRESHTPNLFSQFALKWLKKSDNLMSMTDISATDAARRFADLLDGVEHRGEHYTIVRRGKAVAHLAPVVSGRGANVKDLLRPGVPDDDWTEDLAKVRSLLEVDERS